MCSELLGELSEQPNKNTTINRVINLYMFVLSGNGNPIIHTNNNLTLACLLILSSSGNFGQRIPMQKEP
ncbi:hypothetical protein GCM10008022_13650 [Paenibacillus hunanensis]|nr:hypothetical protein GCM10008022_13650 [Paenibacillus hunanensis]